MHINEWNALCCYLIAWRVFETVTLIFVVTMLNVDNMPLALCLLLGRRRHNIHSKAKEWPPQRRGWQTGSVDHMWHGAGMTEWAHETEAAYPHPRGATMGRSRRPFPTAVRTAAPDCGLAKAR